MMTFNYRLKACSEESQNDKEDAPQDFTIINYKNEVLREGIPHFTSFTILNASNVDKLNKKVSYWRNPGACYAIPYCLICL